MNETVVERYKCNECKWEGFESELDYDSVETCFGDDKVEMCPKCGSYEVKKIAKDSGTC